MASTSPSPPHLQDHHQLRKPVRDQVHERLPHPPGRVARVQGAAHVRHQRRAQPAGQHVPSASGVVGTILMSPNE